MAQSVPYGITDLIANCGGLLGLFTGTSLLSLIEIAYFCSVRPLIKVVRWIGEVADNLHKPSSKVETTAEAVGKCDSVSNK